MATKANLITAINGFITAVVNITKHRNSMLEVVNELYPATIQEVYSSLTETTTITLKSTTAMYYSLDFKKVGNTVFVNGFVRNSTGSIYSGTILSITNSEYNVKTGKNFSIFSNLSNNLTLTSGNTLIVDSIGDGEKADISFFYTTND
jgi:hypothetical protein